MRRTSPCSVTSSTSRKLSVVWVSLGGRVKHTRGVTWSAPNCTVSLIATSNVVMRPVFLSSPENTAVGLLIFAAAGVITSSAGGGAVAGVRPACRGGGRCEGTPGLPGGGSGCICTPGGGPGGSRAPGGYCPGYCCGYWPGYCCGYCCDGGGPGGRRCDGGAPRTSAGGRGGPNSVSKIFCAAAGSAIRPIVASMNMRENVSRAIRSALLIPKHDRAQGRGWLTWGMRRGKGASRCCA